MSQALIIMCATSFLKPLRDSFPNTLILPFSETVEKCSSQIRDLDHQDQRQVWLLFQPADTRQQNEVVADHINLSANNTLIGPADLSKGPRFPDMSSVYEHEGDGAIVVFGQDPALHNFAENWIPVSAGVWEAIALKHRSYQLHGWVVADLAQWIEEISEN